METTKKFDGRAMDYTISRPSYATELIDCLYAEYGVSTTSVIADIGSGTGKFAKLLIDRGSKVFCVEPNEDMRHVAENELCQYANFHSVHSDAENTTLPDNSVDHITTAQAFHWFDTDKFKRECSRIIKKNGKVFLVWNVRCAADPVNRMLFDIYSKYCPEFNGFNGGIKENDPKIKYFFDCSYDYISFDNPLYFDKEKFIGRSLSSSYSLKETDANYTDFVNELNSLFDKHAHNGIVSVGNKSVSYIGTIK